MMVVGGAPSRADPLPVQRRLTDPTGAALMVKTIDLRPDSVVLSVTISNPGDHEIRLNRARSFVLDDGSGGIHHLNPPVVNPELRVPSHTQLDGDLVFIGPLAPSARQLALSNREPAAMPRDSGGGGPVFTATFPVAEHGETADASQAGAPNGVALRVPPIHATGGACVVSLLATNGSDQTIVLNQYRSLILTDAHGVSASLKAPSENRELVVPSGNRLDAELVFDCRSLDTTAPLTLGTNRGITGTAGNSAGALTLFPLKAAVARQGNAAVPARSHAAVAPIAWSHLSESVVEGPSGAPTAGADAGRPPQAVGSNGRLAAAPQTVAQLAAALHATTTNRGWRIVVPAQALFGSAPATLDAAATPLLSNLAALATATRPSEVVVAGHVERAGPDEDNQALSARRAHAVAAWLAAHMPPAHRLRFVEKGYGRNRPIKPDRNEAVSNQGGQDSGSIEILLRR